MSDPAMIYVTRIEDLPDLSHAETICIDFETLSGNPQKAEADPWRNARIALIGISDMKTVWVIATQRCKRPTLLLPGLDTSTVLAWLRSTLGQRRKCYVGHWIRAEANLARADACSLNRESFWHCTEIAAHNENDCLAEYNLKWYAANVLDYPQLLAAEDKVLTWLAQGKYGKRSDPGDFAEVPTDILGPYCGMDVIATIRAYHYQHKNLDSRQLRAFTQDCEVNKIFHDMQYRGVKLNLRKLLLAKVWYTVEERTWAEMCVGISGREFNPLSGPHLVALLIVHYGLPVMKYGKPDEKGKEHPSFDDEAMQMYFNLPIVKQGAVPGLYSLLWCISRYREVCTILKFIDELRSNDVSEGWDGRVHGSIHPCRARGGRTTSNGPNLQNFPMEAKDWLEADEGYGLFNVDASQIEYRFMAHYMQDSRLLAGFKDRSFDQHEAVRQWMALEDRDHAKVFNFGIAFNMGAVKIARTYAMQMRTAKNPREVTLEDGVAVFNRYTQELPCLLPTRRTFANSARVNGYVRNVFGRKAYLPPDKSYKAFNRGNQGGAADLVKNRMLACERALAAEGLSEVCIFLLMVHDELLFQLDSRVPALAAKAIRVLLDVLEGFDEMRVTFYWDSAFCFGSWLDVAMCKKDKKARPATKVTVGKHTVKTFGGFLASSTKP